jgi:hypothetical protein
MRPKRAKDLELAAIAADQRGVVSRAQLLVRGFTNEDVARLVKARRLIRVHQGVYAVGHRVLTVEGWWMAAVLAGGQGAVLSHATAAAVWELPRLGSGMVHITVPGDPGRKRPKGSRCTAAPRSRRARSQPETGSR